MTEMERPKHIFETVRSRSSRSRDPHSVDNVSEKGSIHSSLSYSLWWSLVSHVISLFVSPSKSKRGEKEKENNLVGVKPKTEDLFPFFGWSNMSPTWTKLFHHLMMKIASKLRDSFLSSYRIVGKTKHLWFKKKLLQHTFVACFSRKIINPPPSKGRASCIIYI